MDDQRITSLAAAAEETNGKMNVEEMLLDLNVSKSNPDDGDIDSVPVNRVKEGLDELEIHSPVKMEQQQAGANLSPLTATDQMDLVNFDDSFAIGQQKAAGNCELTAPLENGLAAMTNEVVDVVENFVQQPDDQYRQSEDFSEKIKNDLDMPNITSEPVCLLETDTTDQQQFEKEVKTAGVHQEAPANIPGQVEQVQKLEKNVVKTGTGMKATTKSPLVSGRGEKVSSQQSKKSAPTSANKTTTGKPRTPATGKMDTPKSEGTPKSGTPRKAPSAPGSSCSNVLPTGKPKSYSNVTSRVESRSEHKPGGGHVRIESRKTDYSRVASKVASWDNVSRTPAGGKVKIESRKLNFNESAKPKVPTAHSDYKPMGGDVKIPSQKLEWKAESKVSSLTKTGHKPAGGAVKIKSEKVEWKAESKIGFHDNENYKPSGGKKRIESRKLDWKAESKVGSKQNIQHTPGGGLAKIKDEKVDFSKGAKAKVGSMERSKGLVETKDLPGARDPLTADQALF